MREWTPPAAEDSHDDPAKVRSGYGNASQHVWWPFTPPELAALEGVERARQGDAHAILALAILASGDKRDADSYARYVQRFDQFVENARPAIESSKDDWHRGDLLNRAMHHMFLTGTRNKSDPEVGAYELDQARLTGIFDTGHYNCISSALLYTAIARAFSLPVRGVLTETHAFVEIDLPGAPGGAERRIDVETTTEDGFDKLHDEKFFREAAEHWSKSRGLKPMTFDDYKKRRFVAPYALVANATNDSRIQTDDVTSGRLSEAGAILDPDNAELQRNRLAVYAKEANTLHDAKANRTLVRLFEVIAPVLSDVAAKFPSDPKIMGMVAYLSWHDATALEVLGRGNEAIEIASTVLDHFDDGWEHAKDIKGGFVTVLNNRMTVLKSQGQYEQAVSVVENRIAMCHDDEACLNNLYLVFDDWCAQYQVAQDWAKAKSVLQKCIGLLRDDTRCHKTLAGLESLHPS